MRIPIGGGGTFLVLAPRWADLGIAWQFGLLALLVFVPVGLVVWLYRYELQIVRGWHARGLLGLRVVVLALLWIVVALQPTVSTFDVQMVPSEVRIAVDMSPSMDVADTQRTPEEAVALARAMGGNPSEVASWS